MASIIIKGRITEDGRIEAELPEGWKPSEVEIKIDLEPEWTDEEIESMMSFEGRPLGEIEIGGWEDMGIEDSVEWVAQQRKKHDEERRKRWTE